MNATLSKGMHRLFVALRPPVSIRAALRDLMHDVDGARWQDDDQLHLTLRFIGEVGRHQANDIAEQLARVTAPPLTITLNGVGRFERRGRIDTLWAGVTPQEELAALHHKIDRACVQAGLPPEGRAYQPHITLARLNRPVEACATFLLREADMTSTPFTLDSFGLYESSLGHDGACYDLAERYRLMREGKE